MHPRGNPEDDRRSHLLSRTIGRSNIPVPKVLSGLRFNVEGAEEKETAKNTDMATTESGEIQAAGSFPLQRGDLVLASSTKGFLTFLLVLFVVMAMLAGIFYFDTVNRACPCSKEKQGGYYYYMIGFLIAALVWVLVVLSILFHKQKLTEFAVLRARGDPRQPSYPSPPQEASPKKA